MVKEKKVEKKVKEVKAVISPKEIKPFEKKVDNAIDIANKLIVTNEKEEKQATEVLSKINVWGDDITKRKEDITKPLNSALKSARELFKPLETKRDEAVSIIKRKMLDYANKVEEARKEKEAKIEKRVEKGTLKPETAVKKMGEIEKKEKNVNTDSGAVNYRMIKVVKIRPMASVVEMIDKQKGKDRVESLEKVFELVKNGHINWDETLVKKQAKAGVQITGVEVVEERTLANYR